MGCSLILFIYGIIRYMESIMEIVLSVGLIVYLVVREGLNYKERVQTLRIIKAKDLSEVEYVFGGSEEQSEEEQSDLVPLEEMPSGLQFTKDK